MRWRQDPSPHSQTRSSGCDTSPKPSARSSIRSFTSRNTASFRPMRSSRLPIEPSLGRLLDHDVAVPARDHLADGLLGHLVADGSHEPRRVLAHGGVLAGSQVDDLHALLDRTLTQEGDALHLDTELVGPVTDALVCIAEPCVVRLDPLADRVRHQALICANPTALNVGARSSDRADLLRCRLAGP